MILTTIPDNRYVIPTYVLTTFNNDTTPITINNRVFYVECVIGYKPIIVNRKLSRIAIGEKIACSIKDLFIILVFSEDFSHLYYSEGKVISTSEPQERVQHLAFLKSRDAYLSYHNKSLQFLYNETY